MTTSIIGFKPTTETIYSNSERLSEMELNLPHLDLDLSDKQLITVYADVGRSGLGLVHTHAWVKRDTDSLRVYYMLENDIVVITLELDTSLYNEALLTCL